MNTLRVVYKPTKVNAKFMLLVFQTLENLIGDITIRNCHPVAGDGLNNLTLCAIAVLKVPVNFRDSRDFSSSCTSAVTYSLWLKNEVVVLETVMSLMHMCTVMSLMYLVTNDMYFLKLVAGQVLTCIRTSLEHLMSGLYVGIGGGALPATR